MASPRPLRWLHLSDLHLGCRGAALWWLVEQELAPSVREMARQLGPPDLILLSGDLTFRGARKEFDLVDRFLDQLLHWLREEGGVEPLLLAVPGNHDLVRPEGLKAAAFEFLYRYHLGLDDPYVRLLDEQLWTRRDASFVKPLFVPYLAWWKRRILPALEARNVALHRSHFPGDFSVRIELPGVVPLHMVGLNSTWQQYRGGDFERKLAIPAEQFHAALGDGRKGSPRAELQPGRRAFLLQHHPPGWLSRQGKATFLEAIYRPEHFDLCLHGHLHEARTESVAISGGKVRCYFQAPSLFGLERYGEEKEERQIGYAWGQLTAQGEVRLWPLRRVVRGGGEGVFVHDVAFEGDYRAGFILRSASGAELPAQKENLSIADFRDYLEDLIEETDHLDIRGISRADETGAARRYPIERLYTPLRTRGGRWKGMVGAGSGSVALADLLPHSPRLLIEGQPGAGKTTFLRVVACSLARDLLEIECPAGRSWRAHYLGLADEERCPVPVLLRLAELVPFLDRSRQDDRRRLLDFLEQTTADKEWGLSRETWNRLLEEDGAVLLLDGLDEVADDELRDRLFAVFRDAARHWKCRLVVTSRPFQTGALREMGFEVAMVEPFGRKEIGRFLDSWVAALYGAESPEDLRRAGEEYRQVLLAAICDRPAIRRLATNPVMLTCLCVIHWNERRLPEGRVRVYRAVLRWLLTARKRQREEAGFNDYFAERAFARLALAMMTTRQGKRSVVGLEQAAEAVEPILARDFPDLAAEDRQRRGREWLRFEGLGSGIVEEVAGGKVRFWHLTFQEVLAALQLAWRNDGETRGKSWWPLARKHLDDAQWRETIELLPGCLLDEGGEERVDLFLDRVLALRGPAPTLADEARAAAITGRLLQTLSAYQYKPRPAIAAAYQEALDKSLAIFDLAGAAQVPVKVRIEVAEALGRGGDPRLSPERDNFLEVPGLGGLRLGRYQVTVEEYQRFVENRGYEEARYWREGWTVKEAKGWEAPEDWQDQLQHPNWPVVGVSWFEATAYCRWLAELRGEDIRLPAEAEWEKAAIPARGEYPWGKEQPTAELANFVGNVGSPTPVGVYPTGAGPYGHLDLAGNVWEWCYDVCADLPEARRVPAAAGVDAVNKDDGSVSRVLRGGGWRGPEEYLRAAYRHGYPAAARDVVLGFRVAVAPAST